MTNRTELLSEIQDLHDRAICRFPTRGRDMVIEDCERALAGYAHPIEMAMLLAEDELS